MLSLSSRLTEARSRRLCCLLLIAVAALLVPVASANAVIVEIDPAAMAHNDHLYPLYTPDYTQNPGARPEFTSDASTVRDSVVSNAHDETIGEKIIKDCAKAGLAAMAWDLWWSVTEGHGFDLNQAGEGAIEACVNAATSSANPPIAHSIAAILTAPIAQGAYNYLNAHPDLYGLADWLQIVDYYYVEE